MTKSPSLSPKRVLKLTKETVKNLRVRTGVQTGGGGSLPTSIAPSRCAQGGTDTWG